MPCVADTLDKYYRDERILVEWLSVRVTIGFEIGNQNRIDA